MLARLIQRLRSEQGFGLIELMMALTILNVALMAIVASFTSSTVAVTRAGRVSTATALADSQMEIYRGLTWAAIGLASAGVGGVTDANTNTKYTTDTAWSSSQILVSCGATPNCLAMQQNVPGADHGSYRVDKYIVTKLITDGRPVKLVTIVVRDQKTLQTYARQASTFDLATG